jgi:hypothetical protein
LLDPAGDVRKLAALELARRDDERVTDKLREALQSDEEQVLRHAADALGVIKARPAVEDLVGVLSTQRRGRILISRPVVLDRICCVFVRPTRCICRGRRVRYVPIAIGVLDRGTMIGTGSHYETHWVSIYRTEVQEALIAITGQNFGFDEHAWLAWWRGQPA